MTLNTFHRSAAALTLVASLAGCSTLPRDGPTGRAVERGSSNKEKVQSYVIIDLDYAMSERVKQAPAPFFGSLALSTVDGPTGRIGPGDTLAVAIYEPSGALFGAGSGGDGVRAGAQNLPALSVDSSGTVSIPFAGSVAVTGMTSTEAASAIRRALVGKVGNPQVLVSIASNAYNTVTVLGEVKSPGRAGLTANNDHLLDAIAETGGVTRPPEDVLVRIQRAGQTFTAPLTAVMTETDENVRLARGDQINLVYRPRRYSTFGAFGAVLQTDIGAGPLNLAGAISKVAGLDTNSANARSVLIFRFERPEVAAMLGLTQPATVRGVPVVYRLNLEDPAGFFTANNFDIQAEDILYAPRSGSAELGKFFTLVQTVTRVVYDVSVTNSLNAN